MLARDKQLVEMPGVSSPVEQVVVIAPYYCSTSYLALAEREQALVVTADRVFAARVGGSRWRNLVENLSSNT